MVTWLLTLAPSTLKSYLNSTIFAESYDKTYRQLFALAMGRNFASDRSNSPIDVESETLADAVTLVPGFLYATEALLVAHFELGNFRNKSSLSFEFCYGYPESDSVPCSVEDMLDWGIDTHLAPVPNNKSAAYEFQATVLRPNDPKENLIWNSQTNEQQIVLAWLRGRWKTKVASFPDGFHSISSDNPYFEYNATAIACRSRLKTQKSIIRIDMEANVVSEQLQGSPGYSSAVRFNLTNTLRVSIQAAANKEPDTKIGWRTNVIVIAQDWPNYVYISLLNSTDVLDPERPVPTV
ncbi:uncharacterized protein A1O9_06509 [Exophiala aquamarina CBS 119918]|uniref:Uncharacterized protein n=1 Tax=Exophiala aquamarina CBS 119918 TaxID=1182545 RepID=A0A072PGZ4_9EURO|nr:uncharacterized protein A1O9_06509 [Exophiala aquamarina CBS 119918]KEF58583.1 hypothetical protein A1O9_06509 [Exophiala aquamarina CBS 119918]